MAVGTRRSLIAGIAMRDTKLPWILWFLGIFLISQAKTGVTARLACFAVLTTAGRTYERIVVGGRKLKDLSEFQYIDTALDLKIRLSGSCHALDFRKYAARYLAVFACRFDLRFELRSPQMHGFMNSKAIMP